MNSTMWKIALRTLARDKTYALDQRRRSRARDRVLPDPRRISAQRAHVRPEPRELQAHLPHRQRVRDQRQARHASRVTSPMLGPMLKEENADVQAYVRFLGGGSKPELPPARRRRLLLAQHLRRRPERVRGVHAQDPLRRSEDGARLSDLGRREPHVRAALLRRAQSDRRDADVRRQRRAGHARVRGSAGEHASQIRRAVLGEPRNVVDARRRSISAGSCFSTSASIPIS